MDWQQDIAVELSVYKGKSTQLVKTWGERKAKSESMFLPKGAVEAIRYAQGPNE